MEARASSDIVERGESEPSHSKVNPGGAKLITRDQYLRRSDVVAKERPSIGHGVAKQMDFEEDEGVGPPSF